MLSEKIARVRRNAPPHESMRCRWWRREPKDMVTFDEKALLAQGERIYSRRAELEAIADAICARGFKNILFSSAGGSQAMMDPFAAFIDQMSDIPVFSVLSGVLVLTGHNQISEDAVCFMSSKSGDTKETVAAAEWLRARGVAIVSVVGKEDSPLERLSDYCFVYGSGRPQELVLYLIIGKMLANKGHFDSYERFAADLANLSAALVSVRKQFDARAIEYCKATHDDPYNIWIASGELWPVCYAYAMCVLEESQWIRTKSVSSPDFFHGTLELVERDTSVTLLVSEGATRALDLRVKTFIEQYTDKRFVIDMADFELPGISDEFRALVGPVVASAALQRISKNMEHLTGHSLDIRRYYRTVEY